MGFRCQAPGVRCQVPAGSAEVSVRRRIPLRLFRPGMTKPQSSPRAAEEGKRRPPLRYPLADYLSLFPPRLPLWTFGSFAQNAVFFASFSVQFGFVSGLFGFVLGSFFQPSSFVFKDFLASFPLFFIFCNSVPPLDAQTTPSSLAHWRPRLPSATHCPPIRQQ